MRVKASIISSLSINSARFIPEHVTMTYSFSDNIVGFHCNAFYKGICENKVAGSSDSQLLHASDIEEIVCLWSIRIMIKLKICVKRS
jgi:hypothetical protein